LFSIKLKFNIFTAGIGDVVFVAALAAESFIAMGAIVNVGVKVLFLVCTQEGISGAFFAANAAS